MADVFVQSGDSTNVGIPAPFLQGVFIPGVDLSTKVDGFGQVNVLGGGPSVSRYDGYGVQSEPAEASSVALDAMYSTISGMGQSNITYNFEGLLGPQGPPGPAGPPGIGITNYIGGTIPVDTNTIVADVPLTNGIVFSDGGGGVVTWTTGTLRYKGTDYTIAAEDTGDTNAYIYWDLNSNNTTFKTTATLADALGADKWAMCYNDGGTPYPAYSNKILHGGYIEASTIDTVNLNALSITTEKINNLDVTTGKIANEATSISESASTAAELSLDAGADTIQTLSDVNALGYPITLTGTFNMYNASVTTNRAYAVDFYEGANLLVTRYTPLVPLSAWSSCSLSHTYTPTTGDKTYYLKVTRAMAGDKVSNRILAATVDKGK